MAREMKLVLTDDIDGSVAAETVSFSLDSVNYEIELSNANAEAFREVLAPYIEKSRRVARANGRQAARRANGGGGSKRDTADVRQWARENGHDVSERGRIPFEVLEAYDAAH